MPTFTADEIIAKLEADEYHDSHILIIQLSRSLATQAFLDMDRSRERLGAIAMYLRKNPPTDKIQDMILTWCLILSWISNKIDCRYTPPTAQSEIEQWIAWAEKEAA